MVQISPWLYSSFKYLSNDTSHTQIQVQMKKLCHQQVGEKNKSLSRFLSRRKLSLPLDTEIQRTLRNLRKITSTESRSMENQRERLQAIPEEEEEIERPQRQMTMEDFWRPSIHDDYSAVRQLAIEANNFELKTALITMVQQHQFTSHPS